VIFSSRLRFCEESQLRTRCSIAGCSNKVNIHVHPLYSKGELRIDKTNHASAAMSAVSAGLITCGVDRP
jgi:hypothetical protein